jgi:hypothetical protein
MQLLNPRENPNALVGLLALLLLVILAGPNLLPQLLNQFAPFVDEGVPCSRLRTANERAYHQSLIGREVSSETAPPFSLTVSSDPILVGSEWTVEVVVFNQTLGTIPILVTPGQLIDGAQPAGNGLGIVAGTTEVPAVTAVAPVAYDEETIRLLGPRQRCVHRVTYPGGPPSQFSVEGTTLRAFYRNDNVGAITLPPGADQPAVYPDQGLWVGLVESNSIVLAGAGP